VSHIGNKGFTVQFHSFTQTNPVPTKRTGPRETLNRLLSPAVKNQEAQLSQRDRATAAWVNFS